MRATSATADPQTAHETGRFCQPDRLHVASGSVGGRPARTVSATVGGRVAGCRAGAAALLTTLLLAGCSSTPRLPDEPPKPGRSFSATPPPPSSGAIYNAYSGHGLFEDPKARAPGDLLTILLVERTQAQKQASTSTSKESGLSISNPLIAGRPLTRNGQPVGDFSLEGSREFSGSGDTSQSNQLSGSLTVTVVDRLPNGNLAVVGEKRLSLNQGSEILHLSGIVRPVDIAPDNTVTSDRVGDARIEYVGRGALADANAQGWLSRFFNSPWFPF